MSDNFTEVTTDSWFSRITGALTGVLFGAAMITGASFLIYWNEGRTIRTEQALEEGAGLVVSVDSAQVDPKNAGKLVHFFGNTNTNDTLTDPEFAVSFNAIKLRRKVEMYQWQENKSSRSEKQLGGGTKTVTTYSYEKKWSNSILNSSQFKELAGHTNPNDFRFRQYEQTAPTVTLGGFTLSQGLIGKLNDYQLLPVNEQTRLKLSPELQNTLKLSDSSFYLGSNPGTPEVGDIKVTFESVKPTLVTIVARQVGNSLEPYSTKAGNQLEILIPGEHSAGEVFKTKEEENRLWSWGLRGAGLLLLFIGFSLIMHPVVVLADVVPIFGSLAGVGTGFISMVLAIISFTAVFALSWFRFRPALSALIIAGAVGVIIVLKSMRAKR